MTQGLKAIIKDAVEVGFLQARAMIAEIQDENRQTFPLEQQVDVYVLAIQRQLSERLDFIERKKSMIEQARDILKATEEP